MGVETEIKVRLLAGELAGVRDRLVSLGARPVNARALEANVLFDYEDGRLKAQGCALRLRTHGSTALLTYKGKVVDDPQFKKRPEFQTSLSNPKAARAILLALGLEESFRYDKTREILELSVADRTVEISLDETPFGDFVEIEGEPGAILEAAQLLAFSADRFVRKSYVELYREAASTGS